MSSRTTWTIFAAVVLAGLIVGLAQLVAQPRPPLDRPGVNMPFAPAGRFVVASVQDRTGNIIILDTATGDLYKATPEDFKKFSDRPKVGGPVLIRPFERDKDAPPLPREKGDRRPDREKGPRDKEKAPREKADDRPRLDKDKEGKERPSEKEKAGQ